MEYTAVKKANKNNRCGAEKYTGWGKGKTKQSWIRLGNSAAGRGWNKNISYQANAISRVNREINGGGLYGVALNVPGPEPGARMQLLLCNVISRLTRGLAVPTKSRFLLTLNRIEMPKFMNGFVKSITLSRA